MGGSQGCCPGPVTMEHLGSHTHGGGTSSLVIIRGSGSYHLPPSPSASGMAGRGGGRRWFSAGSLVHCGPFCPSVSTCSSGPIFTAGEVSSWAVKDPLIEPLPLPLPHRSCGSLRQPLPLILRIPHPQGKLYR